VVGLLLMMRVRPDWARYALPVLMAANLILPASNVITTFSAPLRPFYVEWDRYQDPRTIFQAPNWLKSGELLFEQNQLPGALHQLDVALQLDDHLVEGFVYRAMVNRQLDNIAAAVRDADAALALDPNSADAMFVRGTLYDQQHDAANARRFFEQALTASPPHWHFQADCLAALRATKQ
jgi:tetratricopeptide (TPR) repeat protein